MRILLLLFFGLCSSYRLVQRGWIGNGAVLFVVNGRNGDGIVTEFRNVFVATLAKLLPNESSPVPTQVSRQRAIENINWRERKRRKSSLQMLAKDLTKALQKSEWFVTGLVEPAFFSENFSFIDPDVKINSLERYAFGVRKLFDQQISRAELVSIKVNQQTPNALIVTWRLSGKVNIGTGLSIKPYVVYTDFLVCPNTGLLVSQEDRFSIPSYDILLSALFPFLRPLLIPPAPSVEVFRQNLSNSP
jgi:hypothetical protein